MTISSVEYATTLINPKFKHVLEFGVWKGDSVRKIRTCLDNSFKVYGFDSFEGLPEDWVDMNGNLVGRGKKGRFSTGGSLPKVEGVQFMKGWFTNTLPDYLKEARPIALLHIDSDLYSSAKEVLWSLNDYIVPGTIIVFDEWIYNHRPEYIDHEQKAFYEWVKDFSREYQFVDFTDLTDTGPKSPGKWKHSERKIVKVLK